MVILFDIGNTHTHIGLADFRRVVRHTNIRTAEWFDGGAIKRLSKFEKQTPVTGAIVCSVVPGATPRVCGAVRRLWGLTSRELTHQTVRGVGIEYPKPSTIGADRLANAVAAKHHFGAPVIVVDFGTAVTFDVVNRVGNYVGGIIAPGLAAMTDYLYEKTALLPRIRIRDVHRVVGKSTREAMLIGAVQGYRGLVRELIAKLRKELKARRVPVLATGGYAGLIASGVKQIVAVKPQLTLEGLRLEWEFAQTV